MALIDQIPDSKVWWQSKTLWASLAMALIPVFPPVAAFAAANPVAYGAIWSAVFGTLRVTSSAPLTLKK